ncbi:hypothetical protein [Burkholderia cenocepacia]|uniref:hypothetical protein n=1 Tax=Burkholderia cenocepacia TaxID=95486 RepID=UPI002ABE0DA3|nr:hypothetical protein [Burkholderia cenocepacia]
MSIDPSILDGFGISEKDIHTFVTSNVGLCGIDGSRLSKFLLAQLTSAWKHRSLNTFAVTDVIQHLEGRSPYSGKTAKPRQFKGDALRGLWKVHFVDAQFLLRNIYNEWEMFSAKSDKFDKLCARVAAAEEENPSPLGWQGRLAHEFVTGGYTQRASKQKLTGEWLIFGIHEQKNIYLALCTHSNSPQQDQEIYDALMKLCGNEFPDLFIKAPK